MSESIEIPGDRVAVEQMGERAFDRDHPCKECPFSRSVTPGTLGGSTVDVYIGQAIGPFHLACHMAKGYTQENGGSLETPQCAGAAIYRANVGVAASLPGSLLKLPPGDEAFRTPEEFIVHHLGCSKEDAQIALEFKTPEHCLEQELEKLKTAGRIKLIPKAPNE